MTKRNVIRIQRMKLAQKARAERRQIFEFLELNAAIRREMARPW